MASGAVPKDKSVEKVIWLEDIYNYLNFQKGDDTPPPVHIPSTVMLKYQRPCAWFTSNSDGELVKRSDTKELDLHVIKRQFCEGAKHDCVAYYVSYTKGPKGKMMSAQPCSHSLLFEVLLLPNRPPPPCPDLCVMQAIDLQRLNILMRKDWVSTPPHTAFCLNVQVFIDVHWACCRKLFIESSEGEQWNCTKV